MSNLSPVLWAHKADWQEFSSRKDVKNMNHPGVSVETLYVVVKGF
jgi:hypothetical protein